jgi:hypothetical protein
MAQAAAGQAPRWAQAPFQEQALASQAAEAQGCRAAAYQGREYQT